MVKGVEDLRTPLSEIIDIDKKVRGTLSGFMMPSFVVDLPGGGGKRLVSTAESYNPVTGAYTYRAPGLHGEKGKKEYVYYDPKPFDAAEMAKLRRQKLEALETGQTLEAVVDKTFFPEKMFKPLPMGPQLSFPAIGQHFGAAFAHGAKDALVYGQDRVEVHEETAVDTKEQSVPPWTHSTGASAGYAARA